MKTWGFNHKQTYIWSKTKLEPFKDLISKTSKLIKNNLSFKDVFKEGFNLINSMMGFGMGRLFRQAHEIALVGTSNNKIYKKLENKSQRSISFAPNLKHSAKPENLQDSLDLMFPSITNKIELFARRQRKNWICLGNEAPMSSAENIIVSLDKIKNISEEDLKELLKDPDSKIWKELNYVEKSIVD